MVIEHIKTDCQVRSIGRREFKIKDETIAGHQKMQFVAKNSLSRSNFMNCFQK